ncbi:MAG TPA: FtsX-like permease family protein [Steroidobacteraceae bacterium]|nr:FtsX-like permease family protein [Steroidobacteraceae bacterium]
MTAWNIRPIASALWRNRTGALLVALQIAIGLAVLVNAIYVVKQRVDKINRPHGMDVENIFIIASTGFSRDFDYDASWREDLVYLRDLPGVKAATLVSAIPLSGSGSSNGFSSQPSKPGDNGVPANNFDVDEQAIEALGVKLAAGRNFAPHEILPPTDGYEFAPQVIITRDFAKALFPEDNNALGKTIYDGLNRPSTVIGIIETMHGSWVGWDKLGQVMLVPRIRSGPAAIYMVRAEPGRQAELMRTAEEHLASSNPDRLLRWVRPMEYFVRQSYLDDRNMAIFLTSVTSALLAITALGIFGLATFNVSTRIRQIGTRRAVGARRLDIVRHFLVENWMVTTAGIVAGCGFALAIGYWISIKYELPQLDLYYLVGGVLGIWLIGLAAALQPARRASAISPAVATRTV